MNRKIRLTCLSNDWLGDHRMLAEHGFALLIEAGADVILFDTGAGRVLRQNSKALGVDLRQVRKVVLSHGHYDHTGGLGDVLAHNPGAEVRVHPAAFEAKYRQETDGSLTYTGYPKDLPVPAQMNFIENKEPVEIADGIYLTGEIPRQSSFESVTTSFVRPEGGRLVHDEMTDDQALIISTESGLVLIAGCAHAGIINTMHHAMGLAAESHLHLVIGGTHLIDASPGRITATLEALRALSVDRLILAHCTGLEPLCALKASLGAKVSPLQTGDRIQLPV